MGWVIGVGGIRRGVVSAPSSRSFGFGFLPTTADQQLTTDSRSKECLMTPNNAK